MFKHRYYTPEDMVKILLLNKLTNYSYIRQKRLQVLKFGRIYQIFQKDLVDFLKNHQQ